MTGKVKCEFLKQIRKEMAEVNGIPYEPRECDHEGDCSGTCPFCEQEASTLLSELKKKEEQGVQIKTDIPSCALLDEMKEEMEHIKEMLSPTGSICIGDETVEQRMRRLQEEDIQRIMEEQIRTTMGIMMNDVLVSSYATMGSLIEDDAKEEYTTMDPLFEDAARLIVKENKASTSLLQRHFNMGYNRAGRLMDELEKAGIVSQAYGSRPRDVLIQDEESLERKINEYNEAVRK